MASDSSSTTSSYWTPSSDSILSNEDSTTRTFQRTTSAQVTLDEAKAMLADFDAAEADKETAMDTNNDDNIFNIDTDTVDPWTDSNNCYFYINCLLIQSSSSEVFDKFPILL